MATKTIHMCVDLRGALRGMLASGDDEDVMPIWKCLQNDDGTPMTWDQAFEALCDEIALGRRVAPMGECEGFNYQTGCPGHENLTATDWEIAD